MFTKFFSLCKFWIFEEDAGSLQTPKQGRVLRMYLWDSVKVLAWINQISYSAVSELVFDFKLASDFIFPLSTTPKTMEHNPSFQLFECI